jgi:hypothetical protein
MDIVGLFNPKNPKKETYFIIIIDKNSKTIWLYNLKYKNNVYDVLVNFIKMIEIQFEIKIKIFKINNTKEFKSNKFILIYTENGTLIEYISPYSAP